jgi:5-(carboxyamino)imidazole ribonucleotide mutase
LDGGKNGGLMAARILSSSHPDLATKLDQYAQGLKDKVMGTVEDVEAEGQSIANP